MFKRPFVWFVGINSGRGSQSAPGNRLKYIGFSPKHDRRHAFGRLGIGFFEHAQLHISLQIKSKDIKGRACD